MLGIRGEKGSQVRSVLARKIVVQTLTLRSTRRNGLYNCIESLVTRRDASQVRRFFGGKDGSETTKRLLEESHDKPLFAVLSSVTLVFYILYSTGYFREALLFTKIANRTVLQYTLKVSEQIIRQLPANTLKESDDQALDNDLLGSQGVKSRKQQWRACRVLRGSALSPC
jgi:hypothetical protein